MRLWRLMILMEMMLEVVIGVLVMEVDKLADEVTNMDVDKVTNMMAKIREALTEKKMFSFGHCPNFLSPPPPSPQFGQLVPLFFNVKNDV